MSEQSGKKPVIFSGIQPSGTLTIGNYIGAVKNWVALQDDYTCYYSVVDLHAITVRQEPAQFRKRIQDTVALLLACGLDAKKNVLFVQSHVAAHSQLSWLLSCYTYMGELGRMTQYKDKSQKHADNLNAGLFTYPVLMAADILLYQTDLVPIGIDQKQHLELARDIAIRFNNQYSPTFVVPEGYFPQVGAKIMSLQNPIAKMSKSDDPDSYIAILDKPDIIRSKIRKAVTDSQSDVRYDESKPGVSNLITIFSAVTGNSIQKSQELLSGGGYGKLKNEVTDALIATLEPVQKEYEKIINDKQYLTDILKTNAEIASRSAYKTLSKVQRKIGFLSL